VHSGSQNKAKNKKNQGPNFDIKCIITFSYWSSYSNLFMFLFCSNCPLQEKHRKRQHDINRLLQREQLASEAVR